MTAGSANTGMSGGWNSKKDSDPDKEKRAVIGGEGQVASSGWRIDVFGLGQAGQLVLVARQAAEENRAADAEDGGAPAEAVGPGVVIMTLKDQVVELDGVDDQSDDLEDRCRNNGRKSLSKFDLEIWK